MWRDSRAETAPVLKQGLTEA
uniref:Uncharacterized protein n=1 Tax=Arundo donax TaxID=35708 RepID=A0A0A9AFG2_ARUDO